MPKPMTMSQRGITAKEAAYLLLCHHLDSELKTSRELIEGLIDSRVTDAQLARIRSQIDKRVARIRAPLAAYLAKAGFADFQKSPEPAD